MTAVLGGGGGWGSRGREVGVLCNAGRRLGVGEGRARARRWWRGLGWRAVLCWLAVQVRSCGAVLAGAFPAGRHPGTGSPDAAQLLVP